MPRRFIPRIPPHVHIFRRALQEQTSIPILSSSDRIIQYQLASRGSSVNPDRVEQYLRRKDDALSDEALMKQLTNDIAKKQLFMYMSGLPSISSSPLISNTADKVVPRPTFQGMHDEELRKHWVNDSFRYKQLPYPVFFFEKLALLERKLEVCLDNIDI
jgi:hypothetical protein